MVKNAPSFEAKQLKRIEKRVMDKIKKRAEELRKDKDFQEELKKEFGN